MLLRLSAVEEREDRFHYSPNHTSSTRSPSEPQKPGKGEEAARCNAATLHADGSQVRPTLLGKEEDKPGFVWTVILRSAGRTTSILQDGGMTATAMWRLIVGKVRDESRRLHKDSANREITCDEVKKNAGSSSRRRGGAEPGEGGACTTTNRWRLGLKRPGMREEEKVGGRRPTVGALQSTVVI